MLIERRTFKTKVGCRDEVIKLLKALVEEQGLTPRVCTYVDGPEDIVTSDYEFETMEDMDKFWNDVDPSGPVFVEAHEKVPDLIESRCKESLRVH